MHAHQSKAPRATLQHTHTYSTHSTAGTDQFIILFPLMISATLTAASACYDDTDGVVVVGSVFVAVVLAVGDLCMSRR